MKVILNYDPIDGAIKDKDGIHIITWTNLRYEELPNQAAIEPIIKLKEAGFTTEEIIELRRKEIF